MLQELCPKVFHDKAQSAEKAAKALGLIDAGDAQRSEQWQPLLEMPQGERSVWLNQYKARLPKLSPTGRETSIACALPIAASVSSSQVWAIVKTVMAPIPPMDRCRVMLMSIESTVGAPESQAFAVLQALAQWILDRCENQDGTWGSRAMNDLAHKAELEKVVERLRERVIQLTDPHHQVGVLWPLTKIMHMELRGQHVPEWQALVRNLTYGLPFVMEMRKFWG